MQRIAHIENNQIINVSLAKDDYVCQANEMIEADALAAGLTYYQPPVGPKTWPNVQAFMAEFTMQEKAQIALSMDPTIAALRLELTTWLSEVHSDDPRVVMGLDKLVELGIISEQRKTEITTNP
jgi:hypothetical protein